jgi:hypothetical protein
MMEKRNVKTQDGRFLTSMLCGRARKYTSYLTDKSSVIPKPAGSVKELTHLAAHISKPRWCAKDDCICGC